MPAEATDNDANTDGYFDIEIHGRIDFAGNSKNVLSFDAVNECDPSDVDASLSGVIVRPSE